MDKNAMEKGLSKAHKNSIYGATCNGFDKSKLPNGIMASADQPWPAIIGPSYDESTEADIQAKVGKIAYGVYYTEETTGYDSSKDALQHISVVKRTMTQLTEEMDLRAEKHDASKLEEPEKSAYDKYIPMLKKAKYGSDEYFKIRDDMKKEGLDHHYSVNRHHPEHFENGIKDFTLVDLVEYFVDTYAASTKSDTPYEEGLKINAKKHELPEELVQIFMNTVKAYF